MTYKKSIVLYNIVAILLVIFSVLALIIFLTNLYPFLQIDAVMKTSMGQALCVDTLLILLFGLQHSLMARSSFKLWMKRYIPAEAERSTYIMMSALCLVFLMVCWHPIPILLWSFDSIFVQSMMYALFAVGCLLCAWAVWAIDLFELIGTRQTGVLSQRNDELKQGWLHQRIRHPIYSGLLLIFWSTAHMSIGHLVFAGLMSVYIRIGIYFEEKDLVDKFGDAYIRYQEQVPMLIPRFYSFLFWLLCVEGH